jgi:hypothetical protein
MIATATRREIHDQLRVLLAHGCESKLPGREDSRRSSEAVVWRYRCDTPAFRRSVIKSRLDLGFHIDPDAECWGANRKTAVEVNRARGITRGVTRGNDVDSRGSSQ